MRFREPAELAFILGMAALICKGSEHLGSDARSWLVWGVALLAVIKTLYYLFETLWHLNRATVSDLPYHRFVLLIAYNMAEATFSYAVDYYCLLVLAPESLGGIDPALQGVTLMFECFYFSVLNFSFFGYGDITPQTVPAKIVVLLEVVTAFSTVIFLLSDFISMKESMRRRKRIDNSST